MPRPVPAPLPGPVPDRRAASPVKPGSVDEETVMAWLSNVPDPEIPVVSVIDLGIVRGAKWDGDILEVSVTPTYSGCPATSVIDAMIEAELVAQGIQSVRLKRQISPPWTTDWISETGRAALENYGIAPPRASGGPSRCPHCGASDLEMVSAFGSTPCKAQWRCKSCLEPFDYFKCI